MFQIWENDTLVYDLIPVRKGTIGYWYDRISDTLLTTLGGGNFTPGPDLSPIEPYVPLSDDVRTVNASFPHGTYEALDYTPTFGSNRFIGWYDDNTSTTNQVLPSDSIVWGLSAVYAQWQAPTTITFDATTNGGQMPTGWTPPNYYIGQTFGTLPIPTKSGEVFLGWFDGNSNRVTESTTIASSNVSLTARYAAVTYDTSFEVTTTSSYKKAGIYSTTSRNASNPTVVNWGDGSIDIVYGNISQLVHEYSSVGTFTVQVNDSISSIAMSANNSTWYGTTTNNRYVLKKITAFGTNITSIPAYAFYYCSAMTDAVLPANATTVPNYCFYYCQALKGITIPSNYTGIGTYAFYYCSSSSFNSVTIPGSITSIGQYGFGYCQYLKNITFVSSSSTLTLGTYAFAYCFYNSSSVGTIDLSPRKITSIPNYCFYYCYYLKGITWPQNLTTINSYAFRYCFNYAASTGTIEIPEGVTSIGGTYAFANCQYLTAVTLPTTLTSLNNYTFYYCPRLTTITANRTTAPTVSAATFGNSSTYYTGRNTYSAGTNRLIVPANATGYTSSYWSSVLCYSTKCGFTLEEMQSPGIYMTFDNFSSTYIGDTFGPLSGTYAFTVPFNIDTDGNGTIWDGYALYGTTTPTTISEVMSQELIIVDPNTNRNLVMLFHYGCEHGKFNNYETSSIEFFSFETGDVPSNVTTTRL